MKEAEIRGQFAVRREHLAMAHQAAMIALNREEDATVDAFKVADALQSMAKSMAAMAGE